MKPQLDLNLLRCFRAVAEQGSSSAASSILHLSQPAISLQIKKLKDQLGVTLFDRHNRGLVLTAYGKKLLSQCLRIEDIESEIQKLMTNTEIEPSGLIQIGSYSTATAHLLSGCIASFLNKYKNVSIEYIYEPTENMLKAIQNYKLDCAIISEVPSSSLIQTTLFLKDELVYAVSPKRSEAKTKRISSKDLRGHEFLSYPLRYDYCYRQVEHLFGKHLAHANTRVQTVSFDTLKQMLLAGAGTAFIPRYQIKKELKDGSVVELNINNHKLPINFSFNKKKGVPLSKNIEVLERHILEWFSANDD